MVARGLLLICSIILSALFGAVCSVLSSAVCSALSGALCSAFFIEPRLEAFSELSLCAMSAIIFPAASWQGMVILKKVRSSSVTIVALGQPLFTKTFWMVGMPVLRPSVKSNSLRYSPSLRLR